MLPRLDPSPRDPPVCFLPSPKAIFYQPSLRPTATRLHHMPLPNLHANQPASIFLAHNRNEPDPRWHPRPKRTDPSMLSSTSLPPSAPPSHVHARVTRGWPTCASSLTSANPSNRPASSLFLQPVQPTAANPDPQTHFPQPIQPVSLLFWPVQPPSLTRPAFKLTRTNPLCTIQLTIPQSFLSHFHCVVNWGRKLLAGEFFL